MDFEPEANEVELGTNLDRLERRRGQVELRRNAF